MPVYNNNDYLKIMRPLPDFVRRDIYDIPIIETDSIDISRMNNGMWLTSINNVNADDKLAKNKIVHFFKYDNDLLRHYNNMYRVLDKVSNYYAVSSFDFSMDSKMNFKQILCAVYDSRWTGAFLQAHGKKVIPTVGWVKEDTYDICFSALSDGGTFIISSIGTNNLISKSDFLNGYREMRKRFPNTKIICVGDKIEGMDNDVCIVKYEHSFGSWNKHNDFWQPKFFNWDMSIAKGEW